MFNENVATFGTSNTCLKSFLSPAAVVFVPVGCASDSKQICGCIHTLPGDWKKNRETPRHSFLTCDLASV